MVRRAALAVLSAAGVAAGVLVGATPASAASASPATEAISSIMPNTTFSGAAGDTFILTNSYSNAYVINATGSVALSGDPCATSADCVVTVSAGSITLELVSSGTFEVRHTGGGSLIGTLTAAVTSQSTSSGPTDPALVYPTVTFDPNGGTCKRTLQFSKYNGQNNGVRAPTDSLCERNEYDLYSWSRSADGPVSPVYFPGDYVPIGDESFTLFAVWRPDGIEVTYDANVGAGADCMVGGESTSTRTSTSVVAAGSNTETTAPCTPPNMVLAGWALTGDGDVAVQPGGALPSDWANGSSHRLYAKWQVTYELSVTPSGQTIEPGGSPSVVVTAKRNGQLAADAVIAYRWTGQNEIADFDMGAKTVTTNAQGAATISMGANAGQSGYATVTVAYGDQTASATFTVEVPKSATRSVTITGERGTVRGKPGVMVDGLTTGFTEGEKFVPYIKFPGQTDYSAGTARPTVDADGEFFWQRKTGKKIYVYFKSEDGTVKSNRIIIQAK